MVMATQVENKHLLPVAMVNAFSAESPAVTTAAEIYQDLHDPPPLHTLWDDVTARDGL